MDSNIKVVKKNIKGWLRPHLEEDIIAAEIQEHENQGWELVSSFCASVISVQTDTLVFIYRKKN